MKILKKLGLMLIMAFLMINFCYWHKALAVSLSDMEKSADGFITAGNKNAGDLTDVVNSVTENFKGLGQILTMVGAGVLVAVISFMGIKYLISSPDKQAELKNRLIYVVVAGVVIFGAYGIWSAILGVVSKF